MGNLNPKPTHIFDDRSPAISQWETVASKFGNRVKDLATKIINLIAEQGRTNQKFRESLAELLAICQAKISPHISTASLTELLIQYLLTAPILRKIFDHPNCSYRNFITVAMDKVIKTLNPQSWSCELMIKDLDNCYVALESAAATINDYRDRQHFLNTIYEKFFQSFSVKVADKNGIIYTPQPIVDFMVNSIEEILKTEFGKSLSTQGVHILDPFVGTGNFITRVMREIRKTVLTAKYQKELHCNEVMLLPYYIASINIEHEYFTTTGTYQPFEGLSLVDTFSDQQLGFGDKIPTLVIIGNPPYNMGQVHENDNNKNPKYEEVDRRVRETYSKDSKASNKNALFDPYIKAIRWATDRLGEEGIIAFVTNNGFIDNLAFDGMRKHLAQDFTAIYILDLGGNSRKVTSQAVSNVFGIRVGVSINIFLKKKGKNLEKGRINYWKIDDLLSKQAKLDFLTKAQDWRGVPWQLIKPDRHHNWLTEGLQTDFETFTPLGTKEAKNSHQNEGVIFKIFSNGVSTSRDAWVYNFNRDHLAENIKRSIATYNEQVIKWNQKINKSINLDDFVISDDRLISWSESLKSYLKRGDQTDYNSAKLRKSLYRPFSSYFLYFDLHFNERRYQFPRIFPTPETEQENMIISVAGLGNRKGFGCLISNRIISLDFAYEKAQCFPFYTYNTDGTNRQENITDWSLNAYHHYYQEQTITKWDIFYYIYAILHHPTYRNRYADNLKRELPRIPYAKDFHLFAKAGQDLAQIHLHYEQQPEYPLQLIENEAIPLNWRVEKMTLSQDKTQLIYNEFLTLTGIPPEVFEYRLGNRSALEWIIDRYQVKTDKRSGITNDPNPIEDEQYILRLIGQIITVSLETVKIVNSLQGTIFTKEVL